MAQRRSPARADAGRGKGEVRRIFFDSFAAGSALHATLIAHERGRGYEVTEHRHDFYEMMWVVAGEAVHGVNGAARPLLPRDLVFLRPDDAHYVKFRPGRKLYYINVCIEAAAWRDFRVAAGIGDALEHGPLTLPLPVGPQAQAAGAAFEGVLHLYQGAAQPVPRLELCRFLSAVLPCFLPAEQAERDADDLAPSAPKWLVDACHRMRSDRDALRVGLPRFVEMAGVSAAHLTRTLKAATGKTPTEYINGLRLARAATLLATSPLSIVDVAGDCGFDQLSYFYRLFGQRYGQSPNAFRLAARRAVGLWSARDAAPSGPNGAVPFGPATASGVVVVNGLELGGAPRPAPRPAPVAAALAEGGVVRARPAENGTGNGDGKTTRPVVGDGLEGVPPPSWRRG
jgi:AraC-like DNA-binding protein/quercetin dioxygenase-like cupin family protein